MNTSTRALTFPAIRGGAPNTSTRPSNRFRQFGAAVWRMLEAMGRSRARRELLILADHWELTRPDLAAQLREAAASPGQG